MLRGWRAAAVAADAVVADPSAGVAALAAAVAEAGHTRAAAIFGPRNTSTGEERELAVRASVSPGYLSELERGRKEVSSELLASICYALRVSVPRILLDAAGAMSLGDAAERLANGGRTPVRV